MADEKKEVKNTPENDGLPELPEDVNFDDFLGGDMDQFGFANDNTEQKQEQSKDTTNDKNQEVAQGQEEEKSADDTARDNDKKRYQYQQSRADKAENELRRAAELNQQLAKKLEELDGKKTQEEAKPEARKEPTPPKEPEKPAYFSREDALTNPESASAKYLDAREKWMKDMIDYNNSEVDRRTKQQSEQISQFQKQLEEEKARKAMAAEQRQKLSALAKELKQKYNANEKQVSEFIQTMSKPDSLSLDNLWKLYAIQNGVGIDESKSQEIQQNQPSEDFKQAERAQAVPNPMGVLPGTSKNGGKSIEDLMMDKMKTMDPVENAFK